MGYGAEGSAMGYGMDGGMGMMGMGTSMPKTKYKLIRFYDFDVKPGVVYQYRVRVLMEDPNYPKYFMAPPMQSLEPEALKRVQDLDVADKRVNDKILAEDYDKNGRPKDRKDPKTGNRILPRKLAKSSTRKSDWSAPSRMVRFPHPSSVAVGKFSTESGNKMRLATAAWHVVPAAVGGSGVGVEVYRNDSVSRGDIVYGKTTVGTGSTKAGPSLINPITKRVVSMPLDADFHFRPNLVLDVKAPRGLSVSQTGRDPIETSAEVVAVDPETGDVRITHEFNDFDNFRMYSFADEEEAASKKQPSGPAMGTGTPGGAGGGSAKRGGGGREG